jgi:hypothetical protein
MIGLALVGTLALAAAPNAEPAHAEQQAVQGDAVAAPEASSRAPAQGPDLELHVPKASVQKVSLEVENLQARLDLDTRVANLVQVNAGVVATVQKLKLELEGVEAETHLVVRLDRVAEVMKTALGTLDHNPAVAGTAAAPGTPAIQTSLIGPAAGPKPMSSAEPAAAQPVAPQPAIHKE